MTDRRWQGGAALLGVALALTACAGSSSPQAAGNTASTAPTTSSSSPLPSETATSMPRYVSAAVTTGDSPAEVLSGFGSVWVVAHRGSVVDRVNPKTNKIVATVHSPGSELISIAIGAQHVWYLDADKQQVEGVDPRTNK